MGPESSAGVLIRHRRREDTETHPEKKPHERGGGDQSDALPAKEHLPGATGAGRLGEHGPTCQRSQVKREEICFFQATK